MEDIKIKVDILKTKLFTFIGLTGAGWSYFLSHNLKFDFLTIIAFLAILFGGIGTGYNLISLSELKKEIDERRKNG